MSGMSLMLKSMGIDPDAMQKQFAELGKMVVDFKAQLDRIENKLDKVIGDEENDGRKSDD